jgi:hypothetical protein
MSVEFHPISMALEMAVTLQILEWQHANTAPSWEDFNEAKQRCADIGGHGDELLYGGKHCASLFAGVADAIAIMAFFPGGITIFGRHWEIASLT